MTTLYDVTGQAHDDQRVPLAGDVDSYLEAGLLAEDFSRDTDAWRRVTVRKTETGELVRSYVAGQPEVVGLVQFRARALL